MTRATVTVAVCTQLLCAATAFAATTPQQNCDKARLTAWKLFQTCVENTVATRAGGASRDFQATFARCRHTYFKRWSTFQQSRSLLTSTCIGTRVTDNGDGTVTDNLSGLVWEKKTNADSTPNPGDANDADNTYTWSTGAPYKGTGSVFTSYLSSVNGAGFAAANNWRLPTLAELQSILRDYPCAMASGTPTCTCASSTCIDATFGSTMANAYWCITSFIGDASHAWQVSFQNGDAIDNAKVSSDFVRGVRGGL